MNHKSKRRFLSKTMLSLFLLSSLTGCSKDTLPTLNNCKLTENTKFESASVDISIEDFNALGFSFGDSCDITFSNGVKYLDVPYFNGYYVKNGDPIIVGYPSDTNVIITLNNTGIWFAAALNDGDTVSISLKEKGKYLSTQEALGQSYSLERNEYDSDEQFSNFRSLEGGKLKKNLVYRGASPIDNSRKRAAVTDSLLKKNGIQFVVDLADSIENVQAYLAQEDFSSDYAKSLYEDGKMVLLSMSSSYGSQAYMNSVAIGFGYILAEDGPYYIHCMEGKDRTGFVCMLLEALCGASYEEMCSDYMMTYQNYYRITSEKTKEKYDAVVSLYFDSFMEFLTNESDVETLRKASYVEPAKQYLRDGGMSDEDIDVLIDKLTK
jgi:hypothetical protein